jgi:hypothetical protein
LDSLKALSLGLAFLTAIAVRPFVPVDPAIDGPPRITGKESIIRAIRRHGCGRTCPDRGGDYTRKNGRKQPFSGRRWTPLEREMEAEPESNW